MMKKLVVLGSTKLSVMAVSGVACSRTLVHRLHRVNVLAREKASERPFLVLQRGYRPGSVPVFVEGVVAMVLGAGAVVAPHRLLTVKEKDFSADFEVWTRTRILCTKSFSCAPFWHPCQAYLGSGAVMDAV